MSILTITSQQAIKPISQNWAVSAKLAGGVTNYDQLCGEVENKELTNLLGIEFAQWLQSNLTESEVLLLLNGTTFQNNQGVNLTFKGLKYILAYFVYAEYVMESHISDTFTGMKKKLTNESESLSLGEIKNIQTRSRDIALQDFEVMKIYIEMNPTIYPLWKNYKSRKDFNPKIFGIKRTIY